MAAYYNEIDPHAAAWIRQLIKNKLVMDGVVDERSIVEVEPNDLMGFTRHHFFAGIAGWDYALQLAGWPTGRPICTASLPCQPFSVAGAGKGESDERHLLPHFIELVKRCDWKTIVGEQVPGAIKHGWLDDLHDGLEREGYAVGAAVLTAAGAGAPHIRQRLYWVADSQRKQHKRGVQGCAKKHGQDGGWVAGEFAGRRPTDGMADTELLGRERIADKRTTGVLSSVDGKAEPREPVGAYGTSIGGMGNPELHGHAADTLKRGACEGETEGRLRKPERSSSASEWENPDWLYCRDGKYRPIKPGISPLAPRLSGSVVRSGDTGAPVNADETQEARVMRLRGYGNAICPQTAAAFVMAFMEVAARNIPSLGHQRLAVGITVSLGR